MALQDIVKKGSTDRSVPMYAFDNTTGLAKVDLAFNSSGIALWYRREGAAKTDITEATLAALTTAHADGGFLAVGDGEYRLDLPDAAFATGANYVDYGGTATGFTLVGGRVRLVDIDIEDTVRAGLTALPNAAAQAAGGLFTRGTGAGQINQAANGQIDANTVHWAGAAVATPATAGHPVVTHKVGTGTGELAITSGAVKIQTGIKKAQALSNFTFVMTDSTNHNPATGKTVTATRSLDGAAFASGTIANMTEISNGAYQCDLATGDTNGDVVCLRFTATDCDDLFVTIVTEP